MGWHPLCCGLRATRTIRGSDAELSRPEGLSSYTSASHHLEKVYENMEYILIDDIPAQIRELQRYWRPVGSSEHPLLVDGGVREVDFVLSPDKQWVLPSLEHGLSFATTLKKFKSVYKLKARRFSEVDVYAIDDSTPLPPLMQLVRDRPGHASLVVVQKMSVRDLVRNLESLARSADHIGRIKVL